MLRDFASDLNARGYRAVGLVQTGHHCVDAPKLSAMLVHSGEELQLFQNLGSGATGCRLDVGQLMDAGAQVAGAIDRAPTSSSSTGSGGRNARARACPTWSSAR